MLWRLISILNPVKILADTLLAQEAICHFEKTNNDTGFPASFSQLLCLVRLFFFPSVRCDEQFTEYRAALTYSCSKKFRSPRSSGFTRGHLASLLAAQTSPANRYTDVLYTPQCGHVGHVESHKIVHYAENGRLMVAAKIHLGEDSPRRENSICAHSAGISRRGTEKHAETSHHCR